MREYNHWSRNIQILDSSSVPNSGVIFYTKQATYCRGGAKSVEEPEVYAG